MEHLPPPKFVPRGQNLAAQWREFKDEFDTWLMAVDKSKAAEEQRIALLLLSMGKEYKTVFKRSLGLTDDEKKKYDDVITKFNAYFEPRKLRKGYITEFQSRKQGENETVQQYITCLRDMADLCEFGTSESEQLCVAISNGVRDERLREKLWSQDLDLDDIIKKCQQWEQKEHVKHLYSDTVTHDVNAIRSRRRGGSRPQYSNSGASYVRSKDTNHVKPRDDRQPPFQMRQRGRGSYSTGRRGGRNQQNSFSFINNCFKCGKSHAAGRCPAYGRKCNICAKPNHFASVCRNKQSVHVTDTVEGYELHDYVCTSDVDESDIDNSKYVWCNVTNNGNLKPSWSVECDTLNNGNIKFKIDTAAEVNVMSKLFYDSLKLKPTLCKSNSQIFGLGKQMLTPIGTCTFEVNHKGSKYSIKCEIVDANVPNLLSLRDSVRMNLIKRVDAADTRSQVTLPESITKSAHKNVIKIIEEYSDVFSGIGKVPGEIELKVDPSFIPVATAPRPIPIALRSSVQQRLQDLVDEDIIERIPVGTPTPWCSALHVVPKRDGTVRITIDPKDLNAALLREFHPINTVEQVAQRCEKAQYFTVLDANQGYFQLQLDEQSKDFTAFNTPFGRFRYRRLPMGIKSAPELFQRVFGDMFEGIADLDIIVDDFLIQANSLEEHDATLRKTLQRARENNVTFSMKKLQLCQSEVKYAGHKFTREGLKMDDEKIKAVLEMPEPQCIQDVERLLGMVTYVCKYLQNLSSITEPLRNLIKERKETGFTWHFDDVHRNAVQQVKELMTTAPVLKYYSLNDPVIISCDASQSGLGCVLLQNGKPVAFGSKALTSAEYSYAQIEKELLAIVFAFKKFHSYVYGRSDITVETDHLPLVRILEKPLHLVPLRLQKMQMRLQGYDFKLVAKKGTEIPVADALSRAYLDDEGPNLTDEEDHIFVISAEEMSSLQRMSPPRIKEIQESTQKDDELQSVIDVIRNGWPETRKQVDPCVRPYFDFQEELWVLDGVLYKGERIVIPRNMRSRALEMLHESHQGIVKTKQLARDLVYWPGQNKQVEDMVSRCSFCQERRPAQSAEPMISVPIPERPWQHVAEDLFELHGEKWLICVDYYSNYFEIEKMKSTDSEAVIRQSKRWFSTHGIPEEVTSDNGPPWNGHEWTKFSVQYGFKHSTISPMHSQSNGFVEKAVGIAKNMLIKCKKSNTDPYLALLNIRNTPREDITGSPAQRLFSRRTCTRLPTAESKLIPVVKKPEVVQRKLQESRLKDKERYDKHTKPLKPLDHNDTIRVRIGRTWTPARLLRNQSDTLPPRSYQIQLPSGRLTRRNRKDLLRSRESHIYRRDHPVDNDDRLDEGHKPPRSPVTTGVQENNSAIPNSPLNPLSEFTDTNTHVSTPGKSQTVPIHDTGPVQGPKPMVITRSGRVSKLPRNLNDFVM